MSVEEEIELRDLVAQTLETNGCLAKIRAQLRASIFLALDEDVKISKQQPLLNNKVKTHMETEEGKVMFCVVREFLEFFNLYFTLSVFDPESYMGKCYNYENREKVAKDLGLENVETTVPLLLQLIKIAQIKTKNLEINLNINKDDMEENKSIHDNSTSNLNKTDSNNVYLDETNTDLDSDKLLIENIAPVAENLNATFDLSSPTVNFNIIQNTENIKTEMAQVGVDCKDQILVNTYSKREEKDDDTYGDTSSIAEDSIALANLENNISIPQLALNGIAENTLSGEVVSDTEVSHPILKEPKTLDRSKISPQKPEKLKSKNSLNTLTDLPPLQMNKSRVNDILPSLYSKEFKDKSNLRELDKLFDLEAEYEEDFICSGDDLSLKSEYTKSDNSKSNLLDDLQLSHKSTNSDKSVSSKRDLKQKIPNKIISDCNKQMFKPVVNCSKTKDTFSSDTSSKSEVGSNSTNANLDIINSDQ